MATQNLVRVVLWMIGALLSFSTMAISIRALSDKLSVMEILATRSGFGLTLLLCALAVRPQFRADINLKRIGMHGVRNIAHFAGQYLWASGLLLLPLATVFSLEFTMPAWTVLLATLFLGEKLTASRVGAVILGIVGVIVILRPGVSSFQPATLLVLSAALCYALTMIATKVLTANQTTFAIIFWMNVIQLPLALIGSDLSAWGALDLHHVPAILGLGIAGFTSHFCLSNAFRAGDASVVVPIDFLRIPLIAVVGWWLYGEHVDVLVFVGAGIIISGVLWNLRAEARRMVPAGAITVTDPLEP